MKKNLLLCVMAVLFILMFSSGLLAAQKTIAEEQWDNFLETAKLDYSAFHGKLEVIAQVDAITDPWGEAELANGYIFSEMQYSLLDNLEIHSYVDYGDFYSAEYDFTGIDAYLGFLKLNVYNKNGLALTLKGYTSYMLDLSEANVGLKPDYGLKLYTNKTLNDKCTLYNNVNFTLSPAGDYLSFANGLKYDFNEQNALQAITNTRFVGLTPLLAFDVMYKHLVDDKTVYLGEVSKNYANDFYLANTLESQINPSLTVTGQFDVDSTSGGVLKANVRQTVGPLIFNAGGKFELTDGLGEASVNSSIGLNLFDHVILALSGTYGGFIYNGHTYYHLIQVGTGLKIQL